MRTINELTLGTVQFGLNYGINNFVGQPTLEESLKMLKHSYDKGVRSYDVARAYGNAEEILGAFISSNNLNGQIKVISKLLPNIFDDATKKKNIARTIEEEILSSLKRLRVDSLDGYLLHTPDYIFNDTIVEGLVAAKSNKLIKNLGVSIYSEEQALYAAKLSEVDYIQIPYSIIDQRMDFCDFFPLAKKNKKFIFARSVFVQGLLFMQQDKVPGHLQRAVPLLDKLQAICKKFNVSIAEIAIHFHKINKGIDSVIIGVDNMQQLNDDLSFFNEHKESNLNECVQVIRKSFDKVDANICIPSLWKK